ncbi:MAG: ABC transporter ATP-binding protein [Kiritimatiellaeota bacterium]|nr:ABC transporter ATP-binding protein [Kiritimatiellota bacterium]
MYLLEATGIHKTYILPHKRVEVLKGASFSVGAGERIAIIGRSGAGKSTLLNVLGGLDRPDAGTVAIMGQPLYQLSQRRRTALRAANIGFVFQSYHLLPEMDVTENVMLPAMTGARNISRAQMRRRAQELLEWVGLADRMNHTPLELSGGEQQRVALARALVNEPALILADEPTGNLDRMTGGQIIEMLFGLSRTRELSVVMVTHATETADLCDRVFELQDGRLEEMRDA